MITEKKYYTESQNKMARYAKALSHPVRVFILDFLADNIDKCCYSGDMAEELPIARSTLSEHLKELKKAGLIQERSTLLTLNIVSTKKTGSRPGGYLRYSSENEDDLKI